MEGGAEIGGGHEREATSVPPGAHAASGSVRANSSCECQTVGSVEHGRGCFQHGPVDQHGAAGVRKERFDLPPQFVVAGSDISQKRGTFARLPFENRCKEMCDTTGRARSGIPTGALRFKQTLYACGIRPCHLLSAQDGLSKLDIIAEAVAGVSAKQAGGTTIGSGFRGFVRPTNSAEVTSLLKAWSRGDASALDRLTPLLYDELRRLAHGYMRTSVRGHTLQTTALVNEAYLRLVDVKQVAWQDRVHFFAVAARAMRRVLVDAARTRASLKRGGHRERVGALHRDRFRSVSLRAVRSVPPKSVSWTTR